MEMISALVPWLAVLACPLMMLIMMRAMPGGSCHRKPADAQGTESANEEISRLQARVLELEANSGSREVYR